MTSVYEKELLYYESQLFDENHITEEQARELGALNRVEFYKSLINNLEAHPDTYIQTKKQYEENEKARQEIQSRHKLHILLDRTEDISVVDEIIMNHTEIWESYKILQQKNLDVLCHLLNNGLHPSFEYMAYMCQRCGHDDKCIRIVEFLCKNGYFSSLSEKEISSCAYSGDVASRILLNNSIISQDKYNQIKFISDGLINK